MNKKILIVDDEPEILELLKLRLETHGFMVELAGDGSEVLEKVKACKPDLVLLDIMLPGIGGIDICRIIKNDPDCTSIPVLFLTAKADPKTRDLAGTCGADGFIFKPYDSRELVEEIDRLVGE